MADWRWDTVSRRYRDQESGRYMPRSTVMEYVEKSLAASGNATDEIAALAGGGQLSPADFGGLAREEIKQEYIRQYLLGRGGREAMTQADWGSVGGMLKEQYRYFRDFQAEVGDLSEAQIQARLRMYVNSSREAFERAHERNAKDLGMNEEGWFLGDVETEHCPDCEAYQMQGWQPIGTFPTPGDGSTQCLTNCACEKLYRNSETAEEY